MDNGEWADQVEADVMSRSTFALPTSRVSILAMGVEGFDNVKPAMAIISQCFFAPGQDKLDFFWVVTISIQHAEQDPGFGQWAM